jgi:hypothetical protein
MKQRKRFMNHIQQCAVCFDATKAGTGKLEDYCRTGRRMFSNIPLTEKARALKAKEQSN